MLSSIQTIEDDPNEITLQSYNAEVAGYRSQTPAHYQSYHEPMLRWINTSLSFINKNDSILEIGSGLGRDAAHIRSAGYNITCSDGADAFVQHLNSQGWQAIPLNILKHKIPHSYKMIFANAVIPHFTPAQFEIVMTKVLQALPSGGIFAFSVKQGHGEKWITEKFDAKRFIHHWSPEELKKYINRPECETVFWEEGVKGDLPSHTWTNLTLRKF